MKDRWRVAAPVTAGTGRWSHRIGTVSSPELMPLQSGLTQSLEVEVVHQAVMAAAMLSASTDRRQSGWRGSSAVYGRVPAAAH